MDTIKLQNIVIRKILNTEDNELLDYLNAVLTKKDDSVTYKFTAFEKQVLNESLADYKSGKVKSNEEVFSKVDKWLEK